jgi:hypothetical protein
MKRLDMMMGEIEKHHHEIIQRDDPNLPRTIGDKIKLECKCGLMQCRTRRLDFISI